jgi:hypothetical protein
MELKCPFCKGSKIEVVCYEDERMNHPDYFPCGPRSYYVGCADCLCRGPLISAWGMSDENAKTKALEAFGKSEDGAE